VEELRTIGGSSASSEVGRFGLNVLVVTDDAAWGQEISAMLAGLGFVEGVDRARYEQEAVRTVKKKRTDVVIVDLNISGASGFKVTREVLAQRPIPVLLTVEPNDEELARDDKSSGALSYAVKPMGQEELERALKEAVTRFEELNLIREQARDLKEALEGRKIVEKAKLVLVRRYGISEFEAFERLKQESSNQQKRLIEVSEAVVLADKLF
jgi:response regulator NasT